MTNLLSYGISIPRFCIENQVLHPKLGKKPGQRTIIFADEDPITLAFEAASECLANGAEKDDIDAILFASTSPVFRNRYHASFLAGLLDLPVGILALDLTVSPRSGTDALLLAHHLLQTNQYQRVLVVAADACFPPIGEELAPSPRDGHAGCALMLGTETGFATIESAQSFGSFVAEEFTYKGATVQVDARFGRGAGFKANLDLALDRFLTTAGCKPEGFGAVILNAMAAKSAAGALKKRGFEVEKQLFKDALRAHVGVTGVCHALLLLIECLEKNPGNVLLIDYFNGTNIFHLEHTKRPMPDAVPLAEKLKGLTSIASYQDYLALRKAGHTGSGTPEKQEMFSSDMMLEREKKSIIHLQGLECSQCGTVYFIKTQRCKKCAGEVFKFKKLARHGTIFSFTKEHYFPSSFPPVTMAVVDLDGGGRVTLQLTDEMTSHEAALPLIGSKVRLVLRKMMENDAKPNYFWKCRLYG